MTVDMGTNPVVDELLARMRGGDREAAAEFVQRFGPRVRRRIRGQLGLAMRRLFDSQEILSTLCRRLDAVVRGGRVEADSAGELWALVFRIAQNAVIEKARVIQSLRAREGEDSPFAQHMLSRLDDAERREQDGALIEIDQALNALPDATDREILSLWLMGNHQMHIAETVGLAPTAVRKRWQKIREVLRGHYEAGVC